MVHLRTFLLFTKTTVTTTVVYKICNFALISLSSVKKWRKLTIQLIKRIIKRFLLNGYKTLMSEAEQPYTRDHFHTIFQNFTIVYTTILGTFHLLYLNKNIFRIYLMYHIKYVCLAIILIGNFLALFTFISDWWRGNFKLVSYNIYT